MTEEEKRQLEANRYCRVDKEREQWEIGQANDTEIHTWKGLVSEFCLSLVIGHPPILYGLNTEGYCTVPSSQVYRILFYSLLINLQSKRHFLLAISTVVSHSSIGNLLPLSLP